MKTFTQTEVDSLLKLHGIKTDDQSQPVKNTPEVLALVAEIKQTIELLDYLRDFRENHMTSWSLWDENASQIENAWQKWNSLDNELYHKYNLVYRRKEDQILTIDEWMAA